MAQICRELSPLCHSGKHVYAVVFEYEVLKAIDGISAQVTYGGDAAWMV